MDFFFQNSLFYTIAYSQNKCPLPENGDPISYALLNDIHENIKTVLSNENSVID